MENRKIISFKKNVIDDDLLLAAKDGDMAARQVILDSFLPLCLSLIKKYNIDGFTNDDLIQHCNLSILKAISLFNFNGFFPPYVKMAISNNLAHLCKRNVKNSNVISLNVINPESKSEYLDSIPDPDPLIEDDFISKASFNGLMSSLEYLSHEEKRLVLFLLYSDVKCPLKRYSEMYNIPYAHCRYNKTKAFKKLKNILKNLS